ncbi:hypothetical protein [Corallococcus exiguus]|uniref:hypothetical protein n=1 Tax=Corallococcus exiguus TaxID=83462 RepID=UPI001470D1E2|nr:hypothetical protein [Corallococcus exiguus]NNB88927.1 hypothetical protein [Corallococcus exiguus]
MSAENPTDNLHIHFAVIDPPHLQSTHFTGDKKEGMDVGCLARLTLVNTQGIVRWEDPTPPNIVRILKSDYNSITIEAIGFGTVVLKATDVRLSDAPPPKPITLYIGSVIIVGADGNQWRFFADSSIQPLKCDNPVIQALVDSNAVIANLTGADTSKSPEPYVTCYVLNLKSFKLGR